MAYNAEEYTISVRKEAVDGDYYWVARVEELPDVMEFGDTREDAYAAAIDTIEVGQQMCAEQGTPFPQPKSFDEVEVSGRVTLRLPKPLHIKCIKRADEAGVSLNTLLITDIQSASTKSEISEQIKAELSDIKSMISNNIYEENDASSLPAFTVSRAGRVRAPLIYSNDDFDAFEAGQNPISLHAHHKVYHA
ncbi:MAG: type II toxin-antitoxin system HicB family antitoxin [Pantoea sp.]|nr:type II toxin-antitoxin system HicB family antitoxin [Pantoea sp.]